MGRRARRGTLYPSGITGTTAYYSSEDADAEADRLNALNAGKDCRYFVMLLRLVDPGS